MLVEVFNLKTYGKFIILKSLTGKKIYSYLPLINYTDMSKEQANEEILKLKGKDYHIRALNPVYTDFRQDDTVTMRVNLNYDSFINVLHNFSERLFRYINNREKINFKIIKGHDNDLINDFYTIFQKEMYDHGTPVFGKNLFTAIPKLFDSENCGHDYYVAYYRGQAASAALIMYDELFSWCPWSGSTFKYDYLRPTQRMFYQAIKDAYHNKKQFFDFGRSGFGSGTYIYKTRFGAIPVKIDILEPKQENIYKKYTTAAKIWQKLPLSIANTLGPHLSKHLKEL